MAPESWRKTLPHLIAVAVLAVVFSEFLKLFFLVPRPCDGKIWCPPSTSFPSTHTTAAFAFFTLAALLYNPAWYLLALPFGLQRLAVGVHTFTDVLAGALIGTLFGAAAFKLHLERRLP